MVLARFSFKKIVQRIDVDYDIEYMWHFIIRNGTLTWLNRYRNILPC